MGRDISHNKRKNTGPIKTITKSPSLVLKAKGGSTGWVTISPTGRVQRVAAKKAEALNLALAAQVKNRNVSAVGRSSEPIPGAPTQGFRPVDNSYKSGTVRLHWKGIRDVNGLTSGNKPFVGVRDKKKWEEPHENKRNALGKLLPGRHPGITNPFGMSHLAENSHVHAGSFYGVNDVLSAPPASIHQNTEWLAIESGIKNLKRKADNDPGFGDVRMKSTGYVFDSGIYKGMLKAARYKVYINGRKVLDHVSDGMRGNIDKDESRGLQNKVSSLSKLSPMANLHGSPVKGVTGTPPTLLDAIQGQRSGTSYKHPQFTDLQVGHNTRLTGATALSHMKSLY